MSLPVTITALCAVSLAALFTRLVLRRRSLVADLRGPPSPSWLFGHAPLLAAQDEVGSLEFSWFRKYGSVLRIGGCFGENVVLLDDAKAIHHILQASGYRYRKSGDSLHQLREMMGHGIGVVGGVAHQRHRRVMNPAFSPGQLKTFLTLFQRLSTQLRERLRNVVIEKGEVVDIHVWLSRYTLDTIGKSAFGYDFGAIDDEENELAHILQHVFDDSLGRTKHDLLYGAMWRQLPSWFMNSAHIEGRASKRFRGFREACTAVARELLTQASVGGTVSASGPSSIIGKDVLSILVKATKEEDERRKMNEDEVFAQITTLILGAHDTTSYTLIWLFYELSRHPEHQQRIRDEIAELRTRNGESGSFTQQDYDGLVFLNAVIKEILRLYPIGSTLIREASQQDEIPLSDFILTTEGQRISHIPVEKGQVIQISLVGYNRNPSVWGEDAKQWNPERFIDKKIGGKMISLGMYSNLITFGAGAQSCIGWKFAVIEMQAFVVELIEHFTFSFNNSGDAEDVRRAPVGLFNMIPMSRSKPPNEASQINLKVTPL